MKICHKYEANMECFYENVLLGSKAGFFLFPKEILQRIWNFYFVEIKLQTQSLEMLNSSDRINK